MSIINYQNEFITPEENEYKYFLNMKLGSNKKLRKTEEENDKKITSHIISDFSPCIVNDFYTFNNNIKESKIKKEKIENEKEKNEYKNNIINDIINEEEEINNNNSEKQKHKSGLNLNPKNSKHLPTDNLYEINEKTDKKEYNKNDKLIYKKQLRPISNCLLLYLNKYYKKAPYHKFYKNNINNRPITLKDQNYQCYICLKKISVFFNIPIWGHIGVHII